MIYPQRFTLGRPKFQTGNPNRCLKLMILRLTSSEQTTEFSAHSKLLKRQRKTFDHRPWAKKKAPPIKGKQTAQSLEIHFCDFCCRAVEVSHLKMASNEFNSLRKTSDNKIMTFPSALETVGCYCMK